MKKKIMAIVLVLMMIVGNSFMALAGTAGGSGNVGGVLGTEASNLNETNNSDSCYVSGVYNGTKTFVYRVDLVWGDMEATYSAHDKWNPTTLSYDLDDSGNASDWNASGCTVKATNWSNAEVSIGLECNVDKAVVGAKNNEPAVASVSGTFTGTRLGVYNDLSKPKLQSAEGKTNDTLDNDTWTLDLDGTPTRAFTTGETVATVKVTIS